MNRRELMRAMLAAAAVILPTAKLRALEIEMEEVLPEYGAFIRIDVVEGQRSTLAKILQMASRAMEDNFGYLLGEDSGDANGLWLVEIWRDEASCQRAMQLPHIVKLMEEAQPLIAKWEKTAEFKPVVQSYQ